MLAKPTVDMGDIDMSFSRQVLPRVHLARAPIFLDNRTRDNGKDEGLLLSHLLPRLERNSW